MTHRGRQGYLLSASGSLFFALLPLYVQRLAEIHGLTILLHRVAWQFVIACLLVAVSSRSPQLAAIVKDKRLLGMHLLTAPLIGVQWWLFIWAPISNHTVDMAIGYLILPVSLVTAGALFHSEPLSRLKLVAVSIAAIGVALELVMSSGVSWVSALVFVGYPPYFMLHRRMGTRSALCTLVIESGIVSLACGVWMTFFSSVPILPETAEAGARLAGFGALALIGMLCFFGASVRLPFNVFGLLGYLEPVLLMIVALFLMGEAVSSEKLTAYAFFGLAVAIVFLEGITESLDARRSAH